MPGVSEPIQPYRLDREGARALDRDAIEELGIPGITLMEHAASASSRIASDMVPRDGRILILAGRGNNGGDGWAMARQLTESGHSVAIRTLGPARAGSDAAINERRARALDLEIGNTLDEETLRGTDLVVDALFGTGLDRPITGLASDWIEMLSTACPSPVLAVDLPSGLDADSGRMLGPTVRATGTVTFVARKLGMSHPEAIRCCGRIHVASIGTPDSLLKRHGILTRP